VAVGQEWAHAECVGEGDRLPIMTFSGLNLRGVSMGGNLSQEAQGIGLVSPLLMSTGER
jgi:hypothetical protein